MNNTAIMPVRHCFISETAVQIYMKFNIGDLHQNFLAKLDKNFYQFCALVHSIKIVA
jgi:hypothetical protein